jgi:hypothetical protein
MLHGTKTLSRLLALRQSYPISSVRSHRSSLMLIAQCLFVAAVDLLGSAVARVVCYLCPWVSRG